MNIADLSVLSELWNLPCVNSLTPRLIDAVISQISLLLPIGINNSITRHIPALSDFVRYMVHISQTLPMTLLVSMVFIERLKNRLPGNSSGTSETLHRIFLAALILANKVVFDVPLKNSHWARMTSVFYGLEELNLMEKQFLSIVDFDLSLNVKDLKRHLAMATRRPASRMTWPTCSMLGSMQPASQQPPHFPALVPAFIHPTHPSAMSTLTHAPYVFPSDATKGHIMAPLSLYSSLADQSPFSRMIK